MHAVRPSLKSAVRGEASCLLLLFVVCCAVSAVGASAAQPTGWRGDGSGQYPSASPVIKWNAGENILWKTEVGAGQSSPVVTGRRLLITCEPNLLVCLDTETGQELWRKEHKLADVSAEAAKQGAEHSSQYGDATPTPITDGQWVWVVLGTGLVACRDLDGNSRWMTWYDLPRKTNYGRTASPVLTGSRLLIHFGPLACLDAATGKLLWKNDKAEASYGTPALSRIGDVDVAVTPKGSIVRTADGKTLASDLGNCMYTSPIVQDRIAYFVDSAISAVLLPETPADTIACKELWNAEGPGEIYASPIVHGGRVYAVGKAGGFRVMEASTGKVILDKQLVFTPPAPDSASMYPSLCMANNVILAGNDAGQTMAIQAGDQGVAVGSGSLPGGSGGTPTFSGKRMFMRAGKVVYCVGSPQ